MKRSILYFIAGALIMSCGIFSGCSKTIGRISSDSSGHTKANYEMFNDVKSREISVKRGQTIFFSYGCRTLEGSLSIELCNPDGKIIDEFDCKQNGYKEIIASQDGSYKLIIKGEKTKGGYDIAWSIK